MPSPTHAIERWTAVLRKLFHLKPPTRRGAGRRLGRRIKKAVQVYLEGRYEQEIPVEEHNGKHLPRADQVERLGSILRPFRESASDDVAASRTSLYDC